MKRIFITLLTLTLLLQFVLAQPTQADIDKMMKQSQEMMKKYGGDSTVNKTINGLLDQQKQVMDAMKKNPASNNGNTTALDDPSEYRNVDNWKFPAKNAGLLSSLPKKAFSKPELVSFLNDIYSVLAKKLPIGIASSVQSLAAKYNNDGIKMGDVAVMGWYSNNREEALLLIVKAASDNPDNGLLLNNCAAMLNMMGIEQKAIPILKYVLQFNPDSPLLLNNLGQAYAGLGETDTAMVYLGRCIKKEPENPEANNTAGQIEAAKGNTGKAISYFEQSLKGAFTPTAELKLRKIKKSSSIISFVRPRVKIPEYFNLFKYKLPAQCTSINNAVEAEAEYKAFHKAVDKQLESYLKTLSVLSPYVILHPPAPRIVRKDEFVAHPFYSFCCIMERDILKEFESNLYTFDEKYKADILVLNKEYQGKYDAIQKDFADREKAASKAGCCGEGNVSCCVPEDELPKACNGLANQYLPKFAMLTEDWQEKNMNVVIKYFDEVVYWGYLSQHPLSNDHFRVNCFYPIVINYLGTLVKTGVTKIIKPYGHELFTNANFDTVAINEMECPLEVEIPFIVGKFTLNCDKISISGGEGAVFSYEKNFKTKQSTLSVGIGAKLELGKLNIGPLEAKFGAGVSESLFITFDGNNHVSDYGLKFGAKYSAGVEVKGGKEIAPGKSIEATKDLASKEAGVGYVIGVNSGVNFNEGPFKGMIGPA
ncbi:MAG: tetratricopeptide repeat protein, partial [Chitinophagales bacterium]